MAQRERTQAGGRERSGARPAAVAAAEAGPQPLGQGELALQTSSESAECWAALHFPSLPLEALGLGPACASGRPCVVLQSEGASPRVLEANEAARRLGVLPGLGLVAALALEPALEVSLRDPRRERQLLDRVAAEALGFTPRVSLEPPDGVLLEVRGSFSLFGGASALGEALLARCAALGVQPRLAIAPTPLAALVLARAGRSQFITAEDRLIGAIAPLPLGMLRWADATLARLESVGVATLGEALRLPRAGFARRFGNEALDTLDRLVGRRPDPRRAHVMRERFRARCEPSFELTGHQAILRHVEPLLVELESFLRGNQSAVTGLRLRLWHRTRAGSDIPPATSIVLRLSAPEFSAARFGPLLAERLAQSVLPAPVQRCSLRSGELQPLIAQSHSLWRPGEHGGATVAEAPALIERLRARLGAEAVYGLCLVPEHRPERAWCVTEPGLPAARLRSAAEGATQAARPEPGRRPLWLVQVPQRLPGAPRNLRLLDGPERIETGWWDGREVSRDYYVALDPEGARVWVFRERLPPHEWFLHGVFG